VTKFFFDNTFSHLKKLVDPKSAIIITDENIFNAHKKKFKGWNVIVLRAGEEYKIQPTVDAIVEKLIELKADRSTTLIGAGGGVVTDLTGYVASVFMRGIDFGFVPTSILSMVDAAIGGKNGVDVGIYKNMVGTINQPRFLLYDNSFLQSLPDAEWINGFAEIIKHACIRDRSLFLELENHSITYYRKNKKPLSTLIKRNAQLKTKVVQRDEKEKGERRLLNFGHTLGHALENQYELSHGQAVAVGMTYACLVSEKLEGFNETARVASLLNKYGLPSFASFNRKKVFEALKMDKKRDSGGIHYIVLEKIGKAKARLVRINHLEKILNQAGT
jgi:3-dehydroquinate synthase